MKVLRLALPLSMLVIGAVACGTTTDGDGDGVVTLQSACSDYAGAVCGLLARCFPAFAPPSSDCVQVYERQCALQLEAADVNASPAEQAACADKMANAACDASSDCSYAAGTRDDGQPCYSSLQCKSACLSGGTSSGCGICGPLPATGQPCAGLTCAEGLLCVEDICVTRIVVGAGEACGEVPGVTCGWGLGCYNGTCVPFAQQGESCADFQQCDWLQGLSCDIATETCQVEVQAGPGQPCGIINDDYVSCVWGHYCNEVDTCTPYPGEGQPCAGGESCAFGLSCRSGICSFDDPAICG